MSLKKIKQKNKTDYNAHGLRNHAPIFKTKIQISSFSSKACYGFWLMKQDDYFQVSFD